MLPSKCSDVLKLDPGATDGEYKLYLDGKSIVLYCHDMDTGQPKEYITLPYVNKFDDRNYGDATFKSTSFSKVAVDMQVRFFNTLYYKL